MARLRKGENEQLAANGFSLPIGTLIGACKTWLERAVPSDPNNLFGDPDQPAWRVYILVEDLDSDDSGVTRYNWKPIQNEKEVIAARVVVVHPALAGYYKDEGFVTDRGNTDFVSTLPVTPARKSWDTTVYQLESYEEHIRLVLAAFKELALPELRLPAQRLAQAAGWPLDSVLRAIWLVCLLHDVAKLDKHWQGWAQDYQRRIDEPITPRNFAAAHTHRDPKQPKHLSAEKAAQPKRPRHAGESAWASAFTLKQALEADIEDITTLIDQFGSKTICNMLVAFGYASESKEVSKEDELELIPTDIGESSDEDGDDSE